MPAATVRVCGPKREILDVDGGAAALAARRAGVAAAAAMAVRKESGERGDRDGQGRLHDWLLRRDRVSVMASGALREVRRTDGIPRMARSRSAGTVKRPRRRRGAGRGLREGGRAGGVEGDMAFDLLHDLVDMAVEHGHRAEAGEQGERLGAVVHLPYQPRSRNPLW